MKNTEEQEYENAAGGYRSIPVEEPPRRIKKKKKNYIPAKTRAPASTSPEIAILSVLSKAPTSGVRTYAVLKEVKTNWFSELTPTDNNAIYPESKKKIVDSVIKFAKKHLIIKEQVFPPSVENPIGIWRITSTGIERALKETGDWRPKYTEAHSMIEDEGE